MEYYFTYLDLPNYYSSRKKAPRSDEIANGVF